MGSCWAVHQHQVLVYADKKECLDKGVWRIKSKGVCFCFCFCLLPQNTIFFHTSSANTSLPSFLPTTLLGRRMEGEESSTSATNQTKQRFKRICVFCGSRPGYKSAFSDAALQLGKLLVIKPIQGDIHRFFFLLLLLLLLLLHLFSNVGFLLFIISVLVQVERKIDLVYGGGSVGLMGLISQTVFNGGCHVLGYFSFFLFFTLLMLFFFFGCQ